MVDFADARTWPLADLLPLTRPVPGELWAELGVMIAQRPLTVFLANAYEAGMHRKLAACERIEYCSEAELRADGWRVD